MWDHPIDKNLRKKISRKNRLWRRYTATRNQDLKVIDKFSTSDRQMIECDVIAKTLVKDVVKVRYCYDCADYEKIKTTLQEISWPELFANKKVEEMWQIFIMI